MVACTGNQFCGFSQIETKQTAWRVAEHLESVLDMPRDIRMMWTGCPNSCGQVQVADIGLMGCMVKAPAGQTGMVPGVDVFVGGRVGADSHLATVTHPSVPMDALLPLLEGVLVDTFGATRKAVPTPNKQLHTRFRLAVKPAGAKAAPKGTPKKAGNATHICADCGYIYNQTTALAEQPADFTCPQCSAPKDRFRPLNESAAEASGCALRRAAAALRRADHAARSAGCLRATRPFPWRCAAPACRCD
jgi:ferredoxin-nitrite reductase